MPQWLPTQTFWAYATGLGQIAAGVAILTGKQARLAAILLTALYGSFAVLVWAPRLLAHPASHWIGAENALNLALIGVAWIVAESLARPEP
ncbi:MAG: DoxX family membrane protein [Betaproteobacteria bacterium]|nr:DoxX family membrane protein [Betaproteobacteria bacterium]